MRTATIATAVAMLVAGFAAPAQASDRFVHRHKACTWTAPDGKVVRTCAIRYPFRPIPR